MAPDHRAVGPSRHHRLHEAELADGTFEGVELLVPDAPGVGGIGTEAVERDLLDGEGSECGRSQ
jgi:hypothetical protein